MAKKTKKNEKKYIYIIPAVLWMIFIFYMSSRTGDDSSAVSNPMTDFIVGLFQKVRNDSAPVVDRMTGVVEIMVRKAVGRMTSAGVYIWSVVITFVYACSDEIHQLFVADRAGRGTDVLIDMCGALAALLIIWGSKSTRGRIIMGFVIGIVLVAAVMFLFLWPF